jgi:hypothetical protein
MIYRLQLALFISLEIRTINTANLLFVNNNNNKLPSSYFFNNHMHSPFYFESIYLLKKQRQIQFEINTHKTLETFSAEKKNKKIKNLP